MNNTIIYPMRAISILFMIALLITTPTLAQNKVRDAPFSKVHVQLFIGRNRKIQHGHQVLLSTRYIS